MTYSKTISQLAESLGEMEDMINATLQIITEYGCWDKQWVLDQVVRELTGNDYNYDLWVSEYNKGITQKWDKGISPPKEAYVMPSEGEENHD